MYRRFGYQRLYKLSTDRFFGTSPVCRKSQKDDNESFSCLTAGGLDKFQGGVKEEQYFSCQNSELMKNICKQGITVKYVGNWTEFDKTLKCSDDKSALRESCCLNKHKNCLEEAFFLNESSDNVKLLQEKVLEKVAIIVKNH